MVAGTLNSAAETRWHDNGIGGSLVGNYGRSAPPGSKLMTTAENLQGRARYDRYLIEQFSVFLLNTGRYDRFQGLAFRYNLDPGFKYLFINEAETTLWLEAGYDLQHDVRLDSARAQVGSTVLLDKTATDHAGRAYAGVKHAFNTSVALSSGVELLQSLVHADHTRFNFDALLTATVGKGFSFGFGFGARYDAAPLAGKRDLDTTTTVSVIYSYSSAAEESAAAEDAKDAKDAEAAKTAAAAEKDAAAAASTPAAGTPAPEEAEPATTDAAPETADPEPADAAPIVTPPTL
jgi:putative salt-induced outer membrane protein YdiY